MKHTTLCSLGICLSICAGFASLASAESVDISVPSSIGFYVTDVTMPTTGSPNPTAVSFSNANLNLGNSLRISIKADTTDFVTPSGGGAAIPAAYVSWTTSGAVGGTGFNGSLNYLTFTDVFQSVANPLSGTVDMSWRLAPLPAGIRAGNHTLSITWKLESISP
ncbi:MAG: hypothetical protein ACYC1M_11185 [Armatimonadota bacterium]